MFWDRKTGTERAPFKFQIASIFVLACVLQCFFAPLCLAADKIASQTFEAPGWESEFTGQSHWGENMARTTHDPHSGSYALRWNQFGDPNPRTDPITGKPGQGWTLLDWRGGVNIPNLTPNEMFFRMSFRHDDYANDIPFGTATRKLFYLVDVVHNVGAMFMSRQLGVNVPYLSYTNGGYSEGWANSNWGYKCMYLQHPNVQASLNGDWRMCEFYINYDEHYVQVWFDGNLMKPNTTANAIYWERFPEDAAAGRIRYDPNLSLHFKGFQIGHFDPPYDCENCRDESEYYAGFQIDDLEVWNGIPGTTTPESPGMPGQPERTGP